MTQRSSPHPWIAALRVGLDGLEQALLKGDAPAVERASAHVQNVLQKAPPTAEFAKPGSSLRVDMLEAAQRFSMLRQAVLQGQYSVPKGIYYGGQALEPQLAALAPLIKPLLDAYPLSMTIDLHTGYGARGVLHVFPNPPEQPAVKQGLETVFAGYPINWGSGKDFYTVTGDVTGWIGSLRSGGLHLPAVFEFGTLDSQTTLGSVKSLHITVLENQGFQHGYASPGYEAAIQRDYREMFYPSSPAWRTQVIHDSRALLQQVLVQLAQVTTPPASPQRP